MSEIQTDRIYLNKKVVNPLSKREQKKFAFFSRKNRNKQRNNDIGLSESIERNNWIIGGRTQSK